MCEWNFLGISWSSWTTWTNREFFFFYILKRQICVSDNLELISMFNACGGKCQEKLCLVEMDDLYFPENINKLIDLWQRQHDLVAEQTETH